MFYFNIKATAYAHGRHHTPVTRDHVMILYRLYNACIIVNYKYQVCTTI